ncbi:hypothetical protein CYMTET_18030 [Cymbomonas tetramitiformis]|uniref:Uncharacterized protein n=1 Tax=Cymbomonas tetramitiformis TaxID=36881 RepID=A0AAE0G8Z2_9CHLO|nr:hypothetical protein CYMTET_18030 [Cymbomonas tetramitiformis]
MAACLNVTGVLPLRSQYRTVKCEARKQQTCRAARPLKASCRTQFSAPIQLRSRLAGKKVSVAKPSLIVTSAASTDQGEVLDEGGVQYAKLDPVPRTTYAKAAAVREAQATSIQNQIISDVTRYRYGDEQHLDEALKRVFRIGQGGGISKRQTPKLTSIREELVDDKYTLVLVFDDNCPLEEFESRQPKIQGFFGPGVTALIAGIEEGVEVYLISEGTDAGAYDEDEWEILPPLQPGQPPRRVKKGSV